jgi:hypothetical protein
MKVHVSVALALVGAVLLGLSACDVRRPNATTLVEDDPTKRSGTSADPGKPTLAVLVVVDQLAGDMPIRWQKLFGKGGFERLASEGAWYQACFYPYANTMTGPGHATVATGCSPDVHGVIANDWYSDAEGKVYCVGSERYPQVPPPLKATADKTKGPRGVSPERLLAPTLADALKEQTKKAGKVVSLSLKDRSAVLPAGRSSPDAVYWNDKDGRFVTSTYYRDTPHDWVKAFNAAGHADRWLNQTWDRYRPDVDYARWAGPDDVAGEANVYGMGRTFPHPLSLGSGKQKGKRNYYNAVATSPMGNDLLLELTKRAIDAEKLGRRDVPDFLAVSFSSNDLVGHAFGPDSQEVLDTTLRTDVVLRDLMASLDEKVGKGRWVLALTADHGICPLPEAARPEKGAKRVAALKLDEVEKFLDNLYPAKDKQKSPGRWIAANVSQQLYLNRARLKARGVAAAEVSRILAAWMAAQAGVIAAYARAPIEAPAPEDDPILRCVQRSYEKGRSGDVTYVTEPYCLIGLEKGTTHGTPHDYDRHVPLMVLGPGVVPGVRKEERVSPEAAAAVLAEALGIKPPAKAAVAAPVGLLKPR